MRHRHNRAEVTLAAGVAAGATVGAAVAWLLQPPPTVSTQIETHQVHASPSELKGLNHEITQLTQEMQAEMLGLGHNLAILDSDNARLAQLVATARINSLAQTEQVNALKADMERLTREKDDLRFDNKQLHIQLLAGAVNNKKMLDDRKLRARSESNKPERMMGLGRIFRKAVQDTLQLTHGSNPASGRTSPSSLP